jgi:AraC-like DNA-binding protein
MSLVVLSAAKERHNSMPGPVRTIDFDAPLGTWQLSSAAPATDLAGAVLEYWEVQGTLAPFRETLLPNGAVEIMVNLGPVHEVHSEQGRGLWKDAWISGIQERALTIESLDGTHLVSARLHPLGAVELLGEHVASVANRITPIEAILGPTSLALRGQLTEATSAVERFAILETFVRALGPHIGRPVPEFLRRATATIDEMHGVVRLSELHEEIGMSRRHLSVTFSRYVGLSAKRYAAIRRFMWTLGQLRGQTAVDWSKLAAEAGYSDQSHLARDFRRIGAATPTEYLRRATPAADALIDEPS